MLLDVINKKRVSLNADNWIEITEYLFDNQCFYLYSILEIYNHLEFTNYARDKIHFKNSGTYYIEIRIYESKKNFGIFYTGGRWLPDESNELNIISGNAFLRKIKFSKCFDDVMDENQ